MTLNRQEPEQVRSRTAQRILSRLCLLSCFVFSSCGYPGDILPPALNIPVRVTDLAAVERGDKIEISFTVPTLTTENLELTKATPDLRIGTPPDGAAAVPEWAPNAVPITVGEKAPGRVVVPVDAKPYTGKTVLIVVRLASKKRRFSEWSTPVQLNVVAPLKAPEPIAATAVAPYGVRVQWPAAGVPGVSYRVFRQGPGDSDPVSLATVTEATFLDTTAQYDVAYQYRVQAVQEKAESDVSAPRSITPKDEFPPAVPTGLSAIAGINTVELNWDRNTDPDFAEFRVYRTDETGTRTRIAEKVLTPVFSDRQVQAGKHYRYSVTAVDRVNNESKPSNEAEVTAP